MNVPESSPPPTASILLVDDHPANVVALEAILGPLGHELSPPRRAKRRCASSCGADFALILLDVQMAGLDGFQTANLIKQRPRSRYIPIIFITAVGRDADHVFRGYSEGAVDYLVKPFDPDILRSKVQVFVELHLKEEQLKAQAKLLREHERDALLRAGEERYRHLLDVMPQSIWASDAEGRITFWNRAGVDYLGHEAGAMTGESLWSALHPEDRASVREAFEEGFARKEPFERQIRLRRASDGTYRWHLARVVPERGSDGDGAITGWIATATDIDDQKKAEQVLREAIGLREDFLSVASHELRTPLTSLRLEVENLLRFARRKAGEAAADVIMRTERIDAQAARLNHLIDELLDVSRIAAGRLELQIEEVDLVAVVTEVRTRLGDEARRRGCVMDVRGLRTGRGRLGCQPPRPGDHQPALERHQVRRRQADRDHRRRDRRPAPCWRSTTTAWASRPRIKIGSSERFERAASSRNYSGIGLGLWIVKQIVEALGGTVQRRQPPGAGRDLHRRAAQDPARPASAGPRHWRPGPGRGAARRELNRRRRRRQSAPTARNAAARNLSHRRKRGLPNRTALAKKSRANPRLAELLGVRSAALCYCLKLGRTMRVVKAVAVREPWASQIAAGATTTAFKSFRTPYRGEILIVCDEEPWYGVALAELMRRSGDHPGDGRAAAPRLRLGVPERRRVTRFPAVHRSGLYTVEVPEGALPETLQAPIFADDRAADGQRRERSSGRRRRPAPGARRPAPRPRRPARADRALQARRQSRPDTMKRSPARWSRSRARPRTW